MKVNKSCLVCFTVRSGSAMMCQLLADTGFAWLPEEQFFHNINPAYLTGGDIADYGRYLARTITAATTRNGVFGSKIGAGFWHNFIRRVRTINELTSLRPRIALAQLFPNLH